MVLFYDPTSEIFFNVLINWEEVFKIKPHDHSITTLAVINIHANAFAMI